MTARRFNDYVSEYRKSGALNIDSAVLVLNGEAENDVSESDVTAMGREVHRFSFAPDALSSPLPAAAERKSVPNFSRSRGELGFVFPIAKRTGNAFDHISVGRTPTNDVVLPLQQVSKFHAYFRREDAEHFLIADAGSTNGTWLGPKRLAVRKPEPVNDNVRVRLGPYSFTFLRPAAFVELIKQRAR